MGPKNVHILIPEPVNMTPCMAKRTLQMDVIKVKDLEVGRLSRWVQCNHKGHHKEKRGVRVRKDVTTESEGRVM